MPHMNLTHHYLIAMPDMADPFFAGSVVYIYSHSTEEGALGLIMNKPSPIPVHQGWGHSWNSMPDYLRDAYVLVGGPVHINRGFILHSPPGNWNNSTRINDHLALTASSDILEHWGDQTQVEQAQLFIGHAVWSAGQLEHELAHNSWLTVAADPEAFFRTPPDERYAAAMKLLNIRPEQLGRAAHA